MLALIIRPEERIEIVYSVPKRLRSAIAQLSHYQRGELADRLAAVETMGPCGDRAGRADARFPRRRKIRANPVLQINSGKLYSRGVGRTNHLRGVLYSNLELCYGYDVVTAAGTLRETDGPRGNRAIVFEIEEQIEAAEEGPGFLVSHTIAPFLTDFSALATFGLRAIRLQIPMLLPGSCRPSLALLPTIPRASLCAAILSRAFRFKRTK